MFRCNYPPRDGDQKIACHNTLFGAQKEKKTITTVFSSLFGPFSPKKLQN